MESQLFIQDGPIVTCAGNDSTVDLALSMVRQVAGERTARMVGDRLNRDAIRNGSDAQPLPFVSNRFSQVTVRRAAQLFARYTEPPISPREVAEHLGIGVRQLQRLFKHHVGQTPNRFSVTCRLEKARRLLRHTALSSTEIAAATGFESPSHFARRYLELFGERPSRDRRVC